MRVAGWLLNGCGFVILFTVGYVAVRLLREALEHKS